MINKEEKIRAEKKEKGQIQPGKRVFVLGSFIVDLCFRSQRMPNEGETIRSEAFLMGPGGKGSNQAIAARRGGGEVSFLTAVGGDRLAGLAEETLRNEGIATTYLHRLEDESTGVAFIHVNSKTGQNRIIVFTGANAALRPDHVRAAEDEIRQAKVFLTQLEQPLDTAAAGFTIARSHGVITILNPAPALPLDSKVISLCDVITPNESEITALTGLPAETDDDIRNAAAALKRMGASNVVVTLGDRGAFLLDEMGGQFIAPFGPVEVVDTTGAGDAFNGGLAVALAEGMCLREAVERGNAAGALCVTRPGTAPAMPSLAEIESLIGQSKL